MFDLFGPPDIQLVTALTSLIIGAIIWRSERGVEGRLFALFFFTASAWAVMMGIALVSAPEIAMPLARFCVLVVSVAGAFFWASAYSLAHKASAKLIGTITAASALLGAVVGFVVGEPAFHTGGSNPFVYTGMIYVWMALPVGLAAMAFYHMFSVIKRLPKDKMKMRFRRFTFWIGGACVAAVVLNVVSTIPDMPQVGVIGLLLVAYATYHTFIRPA
ncbi:MAG: hypothetical protein QXU82_01310 [Candidatus Aenigmatarchaeota archaeon]